MAKSKNPPVPFTHKEIASELRDIFIKRMELLRDLGDLVDRENCLLARLESLASLQDQR